MTNQIIIHPLETEPTQLKLCQICGYKCSNYTCPRCSIRYCSLECYKGESHCNCSEQFYQTQVTDQLKSMRVDDSVEMMRILKRMHEQDNIDDVQDRFADVDLDQLSIQEIKQKLTKQEIEQFENILKSKEALDVLIQEWKPWWETNQTPEITLLKQTVKHNVNLIYSVVDVIFSYVATMRTFSGDLIENVTEAAEFVLEHSYILSLPKDSTFVYTCISEAIDMAKHQIQKSSFGFLPESLQLFHKDVTRIFSQSTFIQVAISDLKNLFHNYYLLNRSSIRLRISKKLEFFMHLIPHDTSVFCLAIENEFRKWKPDVHLAKPTKLIQEL